MRIAAVIVALTVMAVSLVHIRRAELVARHDAQELQLQQVTLRRQLWDQQITLSNLATPAEVRRRAEEMSLDLVNKGPSAMTAPGNPRDPSAPARRR